MEVVEEISPGTTMKNRIPTQDHVSMPVDGQNAVIRHTGKTPKATLRLQSAVVIGSTTLAIFCTEQVRAAGHEVCSVVAMDDVFGTWAAREGIRIIDSVVALEAELAKRPVDWLFSVVNPVILSVSLIKRVREGAFNYHDSPLPRYAGTHATSWALLARETEYAVSWHTITDNVDAGQIAIQQPVCIDLYDTALTLNLKCYQAARQSFSKLLVQLEQGNLLTWPQDGSRRSFYRRTRRPEAGAYLDWTQPAEALSAMVRALDFGELYPNPLTCPKLILTSGTVQVSKLQHIEQRSGTSPGTVISIGSKGWCITTSNNDVWISNLMTLEGNPVDPEALAHEIGLQPGKQLPKLTAEQACNISETLEALTPYEMFWHDRLALLQPIQLPYEMGPKNNVPQWVKMAWCDPIPYCSGKSPRLTILGAFAIYLARLTGQSRLQIGWELVPVLEQLKLPKILASTVPMKCEINWDSPFTDIIKQIEVEIRLLNQKRTYPRDLVCRYPALRAISELKTAKPWQIAVSMVDDSAHEDAIGSLLTLQIDSHGRFRWIYDAQRLETNDINRISDHLRELARSAVSNTDAPVALLNLLPEAERELLLKTWNDTKTTYPDKACIHQLFEKQVACTPNATAIVFKSEHLSYAQLNARANQLAHRLIELNVAPGNFVATLLERSTELVIAQLAILKAGAVYVPLDPTAPSDRHHWIVDDCSARLLITNIRNENFSIPSLQLKEVDLEKRDVLNPQLPGSSLDIAYVMYTSGSTGTPKGVLVRHREIARLIINNGYAEIGPNDRVAFAANPSFDASTFEMWGPLLNGGTLVVVDRETVLNVHIFCHTLQEERINILWLTVGLFNQFVAVLADLFCQLDILIVGGDTLDPSTINAVLSNKPPKRLINGYGVTESTTFATTYTIDVITDEPGSIPIGRPIANTRIYLLDEYGQLVPRGALGELHIGGDGVACGYLNRPEFTAERFLPDPFVDDPNARMYKTGDLARYLPDGNLVCLGRNDYQVKIRGYRIEPGEIEARLIKHPAVHQVVVIALGKQDKRLVAYVVVGDKVSVGDLREYLANYLPDYMVPSAFVQLDMLPLTLNGKIDRRALPAPDTNSLAHSAYEAPVGPIETALAEVWRELLGVAKVSRHDSFFALGGHSLIAVHLNNRIASFGAELSLATLFTSPTLAALSAAIQTQRDSGAVMRPPITTIARDGGLPLSFAQQRLWFLTKFDGASNAYHIPLALHMKGPLDIFAWQKSLDTLWARHEALRSVFVSVDGKPEVRLLNVEQGLPLRFIDLEETKHLATLCAKETKSSFDLTSGPLIRALLIRCTDGSHMFLLTQHHIVSDGWSARVLMSELSALYRAYRNQQPNPLPPLTIQYSDYAAWQRQWLSVERMQEQADYWKKTLTNAPARLNLHTDRPRPTQQSFVGNSVPIELDVELTLNLMRLSQQHDVTLFMTLLAAWAAVLSRLSGQDEIVIGTPSANRGQCEIESLIGFFVNTLAMRVDLREKLSVAELLAQIKKTTLQAQAHQDLPFEQVVEILQPPRDLDCTPVFQVMFAWQNNEKGSWALPGIDVSPAKCTYDVSKFDLELNLAEVNNRIVGTLGYATSLFNKNTIERQTNYLKTLLKAMVENAENSVDRIDILDSGERELLLKEWNDTQVPFPEQVCIHQLFEQQVVRTPNATALFYENELLSYAQLNTRANQLAHQLIELGVEPDELVAICVQRSPAMIVALLAILKAGAAYVPLDPAYRSKRLIQILDDADPAVVLADKVGRFTLGEAVLELRYVLDPNTLFRRPEVNPAIPRLTSRHLAYVIYTSGTTGSPKGVMIEHRGLVNLAQNQIARYAVRADSRILQFASICFDSSISEILMAIGSGASLYLLSDIVRRDESSLLDYLQQHEITHTTLPPFLLQSWSKKFRQNNSLTLILAGEAPSPGLLQELLAQNIFNAYGPTESTVCATVWKCPAGYTEKMALIGRPISNTRIYLLDTYGQPVPLGAAGELYIGGDGLARGYLNSAALTAECFLPDPFADDPNARMYKTGDLARYLPDGNLMFLGRNDQQVKIRGFRIEPGEIEARLMEHPAVQQAVVIDLGKRDKRLVAYVVLGEQVSASDLREYLVNDLPDYMVPSAFVQLDMLPLTLNGKLDRQALPVPDTNSLAHSAYEAPVGPIETALAEIWCELLEVEQVSRQDSFFALGGHSLLAVRMNNRIASLGAELSLATLFASPTLAALATAIQTQRDTGSAMRPPITAIAREGGLPLSFAQQRLWFLTNLEGASNAYHIPLALHIKGSLDVFAWQQALDTLWTRHEALRSVFVSVDGIPEVRLLDPEQGLPMPFIDLNEGTQLATQCAEETQASFDLTSGPLIRALLIRLADDVHMFLLTQHHIISDGWSSDILMRELSALYRAYRNKQPNPLAPLSIQYPDYAAWQRQWFSGERMRVQGDYWKKNLANAPLRLDLHTDQLRPTLQSFDGASVPIEIDVELTLNLIRLSQQHDVTLFMTLLAAWAAVLSRLSGQDEIVIGTPTANRGLREIEPLIGFFVNTLAMRVDLREQPSVAELLARVKNTTVQAQAYQDLPFEQVVEIIQPPRRLDYTPVFQVMFAWQNSEKESWALPGLDVSSAKSTYDVAKFDLQLTMAEVNDRIVGTLGYATALFNKNTIERQANYLKMMLKAMAANAGNLVGRIDILDSTERELLLTEWNNTQMPYAEQTCIHQVFEQQVARTPNATAVFFEDGLLRYAQLNTLANQLSHQLIELGVGPDKLVAICVERSPAMIVGLLAVLKAGAAYVPLDPAYPGKRLIDILADADPAVVLADETGRVTLGETALASRRVLDPNTPTHPSKVNPIVRTLTSRHLAYVIYTSGSTGTPKGVMVEHRGLVNLAQNQISCFNVSSTSRIAQFASFCFDASISEIVMALNSGASLYLLSDIVRRDQHQLLQYLHRHAITHITLPPFLLQAWKDKFRQADSLTFILAGEALNLALLKQLLNQNIIYNGYGLTESTICSTVWCCPEGYMAKIAPIGRPISNTRIYLLDSYGQPVPQGAVGELYIGGVGLARGYLNSPDLTAKRFLPDPFVVGANGRIYKTGDLARYMSDGNLVFLGRNDYQVKLRGFRIEPGEIEAKLVEHPAVHEAVVIVIEEPENSLIAYVVAGETTPLALREYLRTHLPDYMVPAAFVQLDKIPLTPNGKLDRRLLPTPDTNALSHAVYEVPIGLVEATLADIWSDLLGVDQISRYDSFFALGGHSLLAVQMIERLRRKNLRLAVRDLFQTPVLMTLARTICQHNEAPVPLNRITGVTDYITPEMLPLIDLTQDDIDRISVACVPSGVSNLQDIYALSPLQDGILFHHLLTTDGDPYLLTSQAAFTEHATLTLYLTAVQQVVNRHDILRTAFIWKGISVPAQVVWRSAPLSITELTLDPNNGPISEQLTQQFDPCQYKMDLSQAPLLRFVIAQDKAKNRWILVTMLHHLLGDHTTLDIMHGEVQAFLENRGDNLSPPEPYRNLIAQTRLGTNAKAYEEFFRQMLGEVTEPTLPFGLVDLHQDGSQVNETHQMLSAELNQRLRVQAKRLNVSLSSLFHVAWAQVLSRTSGQAQVVFGTVLFGRMQAGKGSDRAMGLFINTLPIRLDLDETETAESVRKTHMRLGSLLENEHASLALVQRCSGVPAGTPLFSAVLNYRHVAIQTSPNNAVIQTDVEFLGAHERTNYPFTLSVDDFGTALGVTAQVQSPIDPKRVCGYVEQALISVAEVLENTTNLPVRQLRILPESERELLLKIWNDTVRPYPHQACIHQLFEQQAECTPNATAILFEEDQLSYAQLNARSNQLSVQLLKLNVVPDSMVAICVERSPAMIVGLLAILKAGAAYLPLDPIYPQEGLANILTDANPTVVLADMTGKKALGDALLARTVLDPNDEFAHPEVNFQVPGLTSRHLAYVIYTSGSTGSPKGVQNEHQALINRLVWMQHDFALTPNDRVLQKTPFTFDVSVWEIFWTLLNGAILVIAAPGIHRDPHALAALIAQKHVTIVHFVPSMLPLFLNDGNVEKCCCLKRLICSGEALSLTNIQLCQNRLPHVQLLNLYGPTEAAIDVTFWSCPPYYDDSDVPIGRPISNTKIYLLDHYEQPVPLGAIGELCIGGDGVARGYLNRPELSPARFVPDPFTREPKARMYKTGDLARYLPDGNLVFLGRNDHQFKIRGVRIEPGEIETRLSEHPAVSEAVVVALGEPDKRLIAYVVADEIEPVVLRKHLSTHLPYYMLPSTFMRLNSFPLGHNGKLDRRALPMPYNNALAHASYEMPTGPIETTLAEIWRDLIGVEQISRHDSFFALGGHSLLAIHMVERLRRQNLSLAVRDLFQTPSLKTLARTLSQHVVIPVPPNAITRETDSLTPELLPLIDLTQFDIDQILTSVPGGITNLQDIYALSPLQDGILFHHLLTNSGDPYLLINQMAFAERDMLTRYLSAVQQVINRHDILRTAFFWEGISVPAQVVWRSALISITELTLDLEDGGIAEQLAQRFDPRRFRIDLTQAPLLRFVIANDKTDNRWILLTLLHHLIGDHMTLDIMQAEVQAFLENRGDTLPPAEPFRNLIAQVRLGTNAEAQERFFRQMLAEVTEPTLPFRLADVHRDGSQVSEARLMLSAELNQSLRAQAKRLNVGLASLCHVAWAQVLSRTSGQEQVVFGTVLFGRMRSGEKSNTAMGLFINTLPIRVDLDETETAESVRITHVRLAGLLEHEHASLALAQRCSGVPAGTPLLSALLNYRHNAMPARTYTTEYEFLGAQERTNYPFTLSVEDFEFALGVTAVVQSPVEPERVCGYMEQALISLAEALERTPKLPVRQLRILPEAERELLLKTWNDTSTPYPHQACIHQLFEQQVERTPNATAILFEDEQLSYAQLNARSNKLSWQLFKLNVVPDTTVAICVERSPAMIVSILAVLKAGAAYVPLDPCYPSDRLTHILADAKPVILLADKAGQKALGDSLLARIVLDPNDNFAHSEANLEVPGLTSRHLAYVIYTSGSTGMPKGVMIEHRSIVNYSLHAAQCYEIPNGQGSLISASICFDLCLTSLFPILICGCVLRLSLHSEDGMNWRQTVLRASNLSPVKLTPSHLALLQEILHVETIGEHINTLVLGGEALNFSVLERWYKTIPAIRIFNEYGPTETTVGCIVHEITHSIDESELIPIGRPIANVRVYLIDKCDRLVPVGVVGELCIGGDGVARGYLNRPDLTAECFLPDPFAGDSKARMYKTGDLARYLPDGNLVFLGRIDNQVKIRGYRVELGEIEARLAEHWSVREVLVIAVGESDKILVAYIVADQIEPAELREHLRNRLPEYMLPITYVRLDAFPLTPNGKLDRRALPAPDANAFAHVAYVAPAGPVETVLAEIWREILGVEQVSRNDSFFALGGHSFLAIKMIQHAKSCGLPCSLNELFEYPLLASFAARMAPASLSKGHVRAIPVRRTGSEQPLFFVPTGLGDHSYVFSLTRHIAGKYPVYALPWPSMDEYSPPTIEPFTERLISFIKTVQPEGPYRIAGYSAGGILAYAIAQSLLCNDNSVAFVGLIDVAPPYLLRNLSSEQLFFEYLAQNTSAENFKNIVDLSKKIDKNYCHNLIGNDQQIQLLGTNLLPEFVGLAWKRINVFLQAACSYEPLPLPLTIHQFHSTEKYSPSSCVDNNDKNLSQNGIMSEWKKFVSDTDVQFIPIPGDHWTMMSEIQNRNHLGKALSEALEKLSVDCKTLSPDP